MRLRNDNSRLVIIGRTGSGKTQAALFWLSRASFDQKPWIIFDYKGDETIAQIDAIEIGVQDRPPRAPGLYVVRPLPHDDIEPFLWQVWAQEKTGLFFDEAYMIGNNDAVRAIYTQGRSKEVPVIVCTQRPVFLSKFVFTEASFYQIFSVTIAADRKMIADYAPVGVNFYSDLKPYYSVYYDVDRDEKFTLSAVPSANDILNTFSSRIPKRRKVL